MPILDACSDSGRPTGRNPTKGPSFSPIYLPDLALHTTGLLYTCIRACERCMYIYDLSWLQPAMSKWVDGEEGRADWAE